MPSTNIGRVTSSGAVMPKIAADHLCTLVDAELSWIDHALTTLAQHTSPPTKRQHTRA